MSWTGYGGVGDYARSDGNTHAVMNAAHLVGDRSNDDLLAGAVSPGETFEVVVGG